MAAKRKSAKRSKKLNQSKKLGAQKSLVIIHPVNP
jgi:hypothetical protein